MTMVYGNVLEYVRSGAVMWRGTVLNRKQVRLHRKFRSADGVCKVQMDGCRLHRKVFGVSVFVRDGPPLPVLACKMPRAAPLEEKPLYQPHHAMIFQLDLKRNPEVGDLIADMQMGDRICFITSLKSKNDAIAEFTLERARECSPDEMADEEGGEGDGESESEAETDGDQMKKHAKMPAPSGSKNTPGGSQEQDRMAAALTAQL